MVKNIFYKATLKNLLCLLAIFILTACTTIPYDAPIQDRIKVDRPSESGTFSTVILMHWTSGIGFAEKIWTKRFNQVGIATAVLHSYNRISGSFSYYQSKVPERVIHLKKAIEHVQKSKWSNGKVFVLGRSHGGWTVIAALKEGISGIDKAVAVAPDCSGPRSSITPWNSKVPLLVISGSSDTSVSSDLCSKFAQKAKGNALPVEQRTFRGGHSVDMESKEAAEEIIQFLKEP
jgi:dienelactone hydrolase